MRRTILLACFAGFGIILFFSLYNFSANKIIVRSDVLLHDKEEDEDGIMEAQRQEFEMTKDVNLGYVPKNRLINAYQDLMRIRKKQGSSVLKMAGLSWTERGPNADAVGPSNGNGRSGAGRVASGRLRAICVDLADNTNKTVWVGGVDGGLWKTTNITASPANWTLVNDFFSNLAISTIAQDPSNNNIMYFGTGEKSFNVDAVRGGGVWKSTDHGVTWNLIANTTGFWNVSKIVCDAAGNVYVATLGNGSGVQRSTDGGTTWTTITPSGLSTRVTDLKISSTGRLHVICGYFNTAVASAGYRFTDIPSTVTSAGWTSATTGFAAPQYNCELACNGNTLYALLSNASFETPQIYKSTDGGANWAATAATPPAASGNNDLSSGQGWYCLAIAVDPANANNVIVGGLNCYKSTNGGGAWSQVSVWVSGISGTVTNYIHADQHIAVWNGSQVLIGCDGGLFYSGDGAATFNDRNTGLRIKQLYSCAIHPSTTDYFLAGAQDNGCHQFTNGGLGSTTEVTGGDGAFVHIDQDQPQYQFGSYVYNDYRRSTDGGNTWSAVTFSQSVGQFINPTDYDDINNKLYAAGAAGQFVRWDNPQTGNTFSTVSVAAFGAGSVTHVMVSPYTSNRVFFGTGAGKIIMADNANTASPATTDITGSTMNATTVSCIGMGTDDNNLIASFSNYGSRHVWVSTTGGGAAAWTDISGNLPDIPVRWAMFYPDDNTKAMIATEMGVYETANINGASTLWTQDAGFPVVRTDMLQFRKSDKTVAAATHGRGLWTTTIASTIPYVRFETSLSSQVETTSATSGCRGYKDYTINMTIDIPPTGTADVTLNIAGGATATQGIDYDFTTNGNFAAPSTMLTFANGSSTPQPVTIRVYDDASVESTESFTLNYTLSNVSNAQTAPSQQTLTFSILDNDLAPLASGISTATIGAGDFAGGYIQPFRSNFAKAKSQFIYLASELTAAGFTAGNITSLGMNVLSKTSTSAYNGLTISLKNTSNASFASVTFETGTTQCYTGNYSTVAGMNTFTFGTPFNWDGTSNLLVEVCYDNAAAPGGTGDAVSMNTTVDDKGAWNRNAAGTGCSLAAAFNAAGSSFVRPDITLSATKLGNPVETTLNVSKTAYLGPNSDVFFYNNNGDIIARIKNLSAFDYGCTQIVLDRAGNGASAFWSNNASNYLFNKTFHVIPTTNNASGNYLITLYYTAAEKTAWETATGQIWANIQLVKVPSQIKNYSPATPAPDGSGVVLIATPALGTFGSDYTLTYSFTNGFSGFGAGVPGVLILPLTITEFKGQLEQNNILLNWTTGFELNAKDFDIEKSSDGLNFFKIGSVNATGNSSASKSYYFRDEKLGAANYYRLRMNDRDGHNKLSQVVFIKVNDAVQKVWVINNPFRSSVKLRFAKKPLQKVQCDLLGMSGARLFHKEFNAAEEITLDLSGVQLSSGTCLLKTTIDGKVYVNKVVKQ